MEEKTLKNFLKNIKNSSGNNHEVFDYDEIWNDDAFIFVVISERGAKGKSTQAKYLMKKIWEEQKLRSMWLMNTNILIKKEKKSHLSKPKKYLDNFTGNEVIKGDFVYEDSGNDTEWYSKFTSLSTAENEKGSRDDFGLLVFDEFNVGDRNIKNSQVKLMSSLIGTLDDPVNDDASLKKIIIHGNNKTLNSELLIKMGITHIDNELTTITRNGKPYLRILYPIFTKTEREAIKERNKHNNSFLFQELIGEEKHVYYNDNAYDDINFVNTKLNLKIQDRIAYYLFRVDKHILCASNIEYENERILFIHSYDKKRDGTSNIIALNRSDVVEGVSLRFTVKKKMFNWLRKEKVWFEYAHQREKFIKSVIR